MLAVLVAVAVVLAAGVVGLLGSAAADPIAPRIGARPPGAWSWPLPPPHVVVQGFAPPAKPWLPGQRGVVLAGYPGEPVLAAGAGDIGYAGRIGSMPVVTVVHGELRTTYEPVDAAVHRGQSVRMGAVIGHLVARGSECAPRACLHWGLLRGTTYLDPMSLLGRSVIRLLPVPVAATGSASAAALWAQ